ncbi:MAG TPA: hypothetical protein PKW18_09665 [Candidatus Sumerlaeota bacterium]|nr:MAG: hypothetical protein BWY12_00778 [candidate division BRC1 bacterium ADurb.Bin183]HOE63204.1 hypothetical protein [Candidatus Sumerlaeota bacterium]HRR30886.1 hypothetical protein [Candidatus Sumerlaeia bacterium]HON50562.1 hypothetical protein [Candidatus Sumerlaeota bacterium]HOR65384.1 hypothetical protein [Candidatus Sumerlaeota bacterium]
MKRSTYMNYSKKDLERLDEKERRLAILKKYYGRYGERILSIMMQHSSTEQGLNNLLSRLEIRVMEDGDEAIHSEISKWISVYGERRFLEMYKTEAGKQQSAYAIKPLGPAESLSQPVAPTEPPASPSHPSTAPTGHVPPQAQTPSPHVENSPPEAKPSAITPVDATQPESPAQPEKTWPEIERRSGKERRVNEDRRKNVELIFKNKRFGRDRRSGKDRRQNRKPTN